MKYVEKFTDYLQKHQLEQPVGSSAQEILTLESTLGYELPEAYKAYLRLMGNDYHGVMVGTQCFISDVISNNEYLPKLLAENGLPHSILPEKYIAFFCHQGYMMAWFSIPSKTDDPICRYFFEGTTETPKEFGTFSAFINQDILANATLRVANRRDEQIRQKWWHLFTTMKKK